MKQDSQKSMDNQKTTAQDQSKPKQKVGWKYVVLGQAVGVLLGAGAAFLLKHRASENAPSDLLADEGASPEGWTAVDESQPFEQALEEARETVGGTGAFTWRGGVYASSSQEEWMAMDETERQAIVERFDTEIPADVIDASPVDDGEVGSVQAETAQSVDDASVAEQDFVEAQADAFSLGDDGYIHVTDADGNDFVYDNGERVDVSDFGDVVMVEALNDADESSPLIVEDGDDVSVVLDDAAFVVDDDAVSVVLDDDADSADDDAMMDNEGTADMGLGDAFPEPMAFTLPEDDMVGTLTEGFTDDGFLPFDVQPLENCFLDSDPVAHGSDAQ